MFEPNIIVSTIILQSRIAAIIHIWVLRSTEAVTPLFARSGVHVYAAIFLELREEGLHKLACLRAARSCEEFTLMVVKLVAVEVEKAVAPMLSSFFNIMGEKLTFVMVLANCLTVGGF